MLRKLIAFPFFVPAIILLAISNWILLGLKEGADMLEDIAYLYESRK